MAVSIADYSVNEFNSLFNFGDVLPKFDQLNGDSIATGVMKQLFRRHGVDNVFGLALLHKSSLLREGERLTEVRGTSNPLTFEVGHPSVWKCKSDDRQLVPLEFSIEPC